MIWAPSLVADKNPSRTSLDGKSRRPSINSAPSGSRWFRRNHFSLRSITVILTSVTFVTIYICTYGEAPHWSTNARRLGDLAAAHVQGAFGYSFAEPPKTVEERVGDRKFLVRDWSWVTKAFLESFFKSCLILRRYCHFAFFQTTRQPDRPWLGWNNVRYIIETGLLLANLLDRELVLPGFTYATACEFDVSVSIYPWKFDPIVIFFWHVPLTSFHREVCAKLAPYFIQNVSIPISSKWDVSCTLSFLLTLHSSWLESPGIPDGERSKYPDPDEGKDFLLPPVPTQHHKAWVLPLEVSYDSDSKMLTISNALQYYYCCWFDFDRLCLMFLIWLLAGISLWHSKTFSNWPLQTRLTWVLPLSDSRAGSGQQGTITIRAIARFPIGE